MQRFSGLWIGLLQTLNPKKLLSQDIEKVHSIENDALLYITFTTGDMQLLHCAQEYTEVTSLNLQAGKASAIYMTSSRLLTCRKA